MKDSRKVSLSWQALLWRDGTGSRKLCWPLCFWPACFRPTWFYHIFMLFNNPMLLNKMRKELNIMKWNWEKNRLILLWYVFWLCFVFAILPPLLNCRCTINWKKGKNVTVRIIKKKQKHQKSGTTRTVTKQEQQDSFFNFFTPPEGRFLCGAALKSLLFILLL